MSNDRLGKECVWCDHKINKNTKYEQKPEKHKYSKKNKKILQELPRDRGVWGVWAIDYEP